MFEMTFGKWMLVAAAGFLVAALGVRLVVSRSSSRSLKCIAFALLVVFAILSVGSATLVLAASASKGLVFVFWVLLAAGNAINARYLWRHLKALATAC